MRLDIPLDTGGTRSDSVAVRSLRGADRYVTEKVELPFKGTEQDASHKWFSEIPPLAKATAVLLTAIIAVGAPSVWWISRLDTNVENLKSVVAEIRGRTEEIFRSSVQQSSRIDNLEKSMNAAGASHISQAQPHPNQQTSKDK